MGNSELSDTGEQFMLRLFEQTRGDPSAQVSMYDIGDLLGLERNASSQVAEGLIGLEMVELKTLSGGIGISAAGSGLVQDLIGPLGSDGGGSTKLGAEALLDSANRQAVEKIVATIKNQTGTLGLDFDTLTELMADIKSIDAQLSSTRPKTAIIRACLGSLAGVVEGTANSELSGKISRLLGD